jgi:hypothetical protein
MFTYVTGLRPIIKNAYKVRNLSGLMDFPVIRTAAEMFPKRDADLRSEFQAASSSI